MENGKFSLKNHISSHSLFVFMHNSFGSFFFCVLFRSQKAAKRKATFAFSHKVDFVFNVYKDTL